MSERFLLKAAVYVFFQKDGKLLLIRRKNTGWKDGWYSLVSGHVDANESVLECAIRETKEEAGVTIRKNDLQFIHVTHRFPDADYIDFFFMATKWTGEPTNREPDKCDDMQWFSQDALPTSFLPHVKKALENYKKGSYFSTG